MSIQFGRWNFDGRSVDREYVSKVRCLLSPYASDSTAVCLKGAFFLLYGAFHTTQESRRERQPFISPGGTYLTWNGRLDNRSDVLTRTNLPSGPGATDLDIVSSLYESEGRESLKQLVGDWSLSALHYHERTLILAVDFLGTQPLYYFHSDHYVAWSSVLEPLVALAGRTFTFSEEYAAGWLCRFSSPWLTPYREIQAVPPGSFVEITHRAVAVRKYWNFDPQAHLHCSSDAEYEERFRYFFAQAVRRRLRSSGPVVSELSGGMDSSSIVCVADRAMADDHNLSPRLDTLSYFDDTEPNWDERPFVTEVEAQRGRPGIHIDVSEQLSFIPERDLVHLSSTPSVGVLPSGPQRRVSAYLREEAVRVVLSGLGGDECTGGVPDGTPELADLLVQARLATLFRQSVKWCLAVRRPFIHLTGSVIGGFLPRGVWGASLLRTKVPWVDGGFERRNRAIPACASLRLKLNGVLPSVQENLHTLHDLRSQLACSPPSISPPRERRYPFLDRDFLEFLYSVPREQIVRPGRRRSLMRRALRGIVPEALLERKRKANVARAPQKSFQADTETLKDWTRQMICSEIGVIDLKVFQQMLAAACRGDDSHLWRLTRTLALESWLRDERVRSFLRLPTTTHQIPHGRVVAPESNSSDARKSPQLGNPEWKGGETHEIRKAGNSLRG